MVPHAVYDSTAFATLMPIDVAVLLTLIRKHTGINNGAISLGVREAASRCHCSQATALRALRRLQETGLISLTRKGHMVPQIGRPDVASTWHLNFISGQEISQWITSSISPSSAAAVDGTSTASMIQTGPRLQAGSPPDSARCETHGKARRWPSAKPFGPGSAPSRKTDANSTEIGLAALSK
jgi:DNA-binding transcriptional regulator YhcF (GntR family)